MVRIAPVVIEGFAPVVLAVGIAPPVVVDIAHRAAGVFAAVGRRSSVRNNQTKELKAYIVNAQRVASLRVSPWGIRHDQSRRKYKIKSSRLGGKFKRLF